MPYSGSDSSENDLISGFSRLSVGQKNAVIDCKRCFTCEHLAGCSSYNCGCSKTAVEIGCQNKFCQLHQCRENNLKCDCTTKRLLLKYADTRRGKSGKRSGKEVFGWFECTKKRTNKTLVCKRWNSAHTWIEMGKFLTQQCQNCEKPCRPIKVKQKEWRGEQEAVGNKPHDEVKFFYTTRL